MILKRDASRQEDVHWHFITNFAHRVLIPRLPYASKTNTDRKTFKNVFHFFSPKHIVKSSMSRELCMLPGKTRSDTTDVLAASAAFFCAVSHGTQGEPSVSVSFFCFLYLSLKRENMDFSQIACILRG